MPFRPSPENDADHGANVLPVGTHLGEFEILDLIGEGGFGIVYLAYDHSLERQVALKEYMPSGLAKRTTRLAVTVRSQHNVETFTAGLKSFINEAKMLAQFDSQSLVKVHRFWEGNGTAYMVMPFYEGITLKQALKQRRITPSESWIRVLLADLFDAIEIIHRGQCLHRDIAPDNILLLKDGRPLLLDFGAARRVIGDLTQCLTAILKPGYAPIEQYADIAGLRQGPWTDIYALSAVVYYLIAGKAPPPAVARMVHDELVPAREVGKGRYSAGFLAAIDKALSVKPEARFRSIAELRHALDIMETSPRTLPHSDAGFTTTMVHETAMDPMRTQIPLNAMPDIRTRIAPPPTQRSERQRSQSQPSRNLMPAGASYGKREWALLGILLTAGIASGIYLGTGQSWKGLGTGTSNSTVESSGASEVPEQDAEEKSAAASPYTLTPPVPQVPAETRPKQTEPPVAKVPSAPPVLQEVPRTSESTAQKYLRDQAAPPLPSTTREDDVWRQASSSDKTTAYEKYLKEFPKGRYAAVARLRLESKQTKEAPSTPEEDLWTASTSVHTQTAYETYLKKYPKGRYAALAKDRIASFKEPDRVERVEPVPAVPPAASVKKESPAPTPSPAQPPATASAPPAPAPASTVVATPSSAAAVTPPSQAPSSATVAPPPPPSAERKPSDEKLASINSSQKAPAGIAKPPVETRPAVPESSTSPGRKPLVLDDQTMVGNFSVDPKTGAVSGTGKVTWTNGNQFEGTLVRGMKEGKGKFAWNNGQRYSGDWARDMPNGRGVITFADGSKYEGEVRDGMPQGRGAARFKSGDVYDGTWLRGKSHGHGRYTWANGSYWEGEFRDDKRTENGKMVFADTANKVVEGAPAGNETQSAERKGAASESSGN
ncbi:protein kinase domain-containing protein [Noviherbaspirillum sp. ST9]|uniref:protein kinase domain-containing protein n=1 Tax=Noviherbaspirillum sp. ST9 TaxID=3401606 RepID=UPI003B586286